MASERRTITVTEEALERAGITLDETDTDIKVALVRVGGKWQVDHSGARIEAFKEVCALFDSTAMHYQDTGEIKFGRLGRALDALIAQDERAAAAHATNDPQLRGEIAHD